MICPALKSRIDIHCTMYRKSHDSVGEAFFTLDKKKVMGGGYYLWHNSNWGTAQHLQEDYMYQRFLDEFTDSRCDSQDIKTIQFQEVFDTEHITISLEKYLNQDFEQSIESTHPVHLFMAIIDRRLGKRRFEILRKREGLSPVIKKLIQLRESSFSS